MMKAVNALMAACQFGGWDLAFGPATEHDVRLYFTEEHLGRMFGGDCSSIAGYTLDECINAVLKAQEADDE